MAPSILLALFSLHGPAGADFTDVPDWDACTSILLGHKATVEGSGFATHNNDCATCDIRVAFYPARDHAPGSQRGILPFKMEYPRYVGAHLSSTYAAVNGQSDTVPLGFIPQVAHTYAYWEATYPLINEHGLGFGESTCGGQLIGQSVMAGGQALLSLASLMQIALERCKSARCAIETMGALGVAHGFYGEDPGMPGAGEALTIVDKEESWVFHILGGLHNTSATWVAQRVPDDHMAVVANNFIIQKVNCKDAENFMCSPNIFSNARAANLCKFATEADFNWLDCYGTDVRTFRYMPTYPPVPQYTTLRLWRIQGLANPAVVPAMTDNPFVFPFSVPVARKFSRAEVMNWTRDFYKDTEFDMSLGVMAGPYNNPNRIEGGTGQLSVPGQFTRGISIPRTVSSVLIEAKPAPKAAQSIAWFCPDQPLTGVFVPFFASSDRASATYLIGRQEVFTRDSAWWAFNFVSNWMNINFRDMMTMHVGPAMQAEQRRVIDAVEALETNWPEHAETVNEVQRDMQERLVENWWALADDLVVHFSDGMYTHKNTSKKAIGYPAWWLQMIGYSHDFYRVQWVEFSVTPPAMLAAVLPTALRARATSFLQAAGASSGFAYPVLDKHMSFLTGSVVGALFGGAIVALVLMRKPKVADGSYIGLAQ